MGFWDRILAYRGRPAESLDDSERIAMLAMLGDGGDRATVRAVAADRRWRILESDSPEAACCESRFERIAVILCDRDLLPPDWRRCIRGLAAHGERPCVLLVSSVSDDYLWHEVIDNGGYDVLTKPLQASDLARSVDFAWAHWRASKGDDALSHRVKN